ncbi:MAG: AP2 domain-containing protein, partial [Chloroflexales bacterium]|nr:AP2 domain-containing protein [Chloroflexales bacterium]
REDKKTRHKGLTRCDYPERHMVGYMVRVAWIGQRRQKFFADAKHGVRLCALAEALSWRDQQERELGKPRTEQLVIGKAASNTGIPGVTRLIRAGHPILQVTWYEDGRQRRTSISIEKHGERAALALARRIRADAEQRRLGRPVRVARPTAR